MKVVLVALNAKFVHSNLAIRYLQSNCIGHKVDLFETSINDNFMESAFAIIEREPEMVAFSCYIWNIEATLKICSIIKEILPRVIIVLGGPEVSYNGREYLKEHSLIDFVIQGEGENALRGLLGGLSSEDRNLSSIEGLVYREVDNSIRDNGFAIVKNLDELSFPYENNIPDKIVYYEASRGCPFGCSYCLSGSSRGVRYFNINRVKRDLRLMIDSGVELIKFVDRTFNANKGFALQIWDYILTNPGNTKFHFEISVDLFDEDTLRFLEKVPDNLFQFEIGVQTTNPAILKNIGRVMDFDKVRGNLKKIKKSSNIHCHMDLIVGLPGENLASFIKSFEDCMAIRPEVLQLGFLKVLKGSRVYEEREKYGLHYANYPNYHILYTADMSYLDIRSLLKLEKVFEIYYNSGIFNIIMSYLLEAVESKYAFFIGFVDYLEKKKFFERNLDLRERFNLLYDYAILFHDKSTIRDILIHDFIINTRKSSLPDFLKKEIDANTKELLFHNRIKLEDFFKDYDHRRIFAIQTKVKVIKYNQAFGIFKDDSIAVFNLVNGEFCYLV